MYYKLLGNTKDDFPKGALMSVSNLQFKTPPRAAAKAVYVLLILGSYGGYFFTELRPSM